MPYSIDFNHVSKRYRLGRETSLRALFGGWKKTQSAKDVHWAVRDVDFRLQPGETLGIIGPNGAGKTTILKLLSRVTYPTSGSIQVYGRFSALIELGAGFHPDLTGRENIFLNGTILGMSREDIKARFDQIVSFSELEKFIDTPVKRYSSGMYARLGFAIAAHVQPEVLLVDEVLAVGDYAFRAKCYNLMDELRAKGTSLIFVSHNMEDIRRVCDRALVMFRGEKAFEGPTDIAVAEYANVLRRNASQSEKQAQQSDGLSQKRMTHGAKIEQVKLVGEDGQERKVVHSGETDYLLVDIQFFEDAPAPVFAATINGENGETVYDTTTQWLGIKTPDFRAGQRVTVKYKLDMHLLDGIYKVKADLAYADLSCYYDYFADALSFVVKGGDRATGVTNLNADVTFQPASAHPNGHHKAEQWSSLKW